MAINYKGINNVAGLAVAMKMNAKVARAKVRRGIASGELKIKSGTVSELTPAEVKAAAEYLKTDHRVVAGE